MFKAWPKIPRLENEVYHITEKIDGTNACIIIQETNDLMAALRTAKADISGCLFQHQDNDIEIGVWAQSRTRLITPDDDNFGFAKWVQENAEQLIKDLGKGYHFGEWWGQGINRGYGLDHKRFSLFNPTKQSSICYNVPKITECTQEYLDTVIRGMINKLSLYGSYAAPGYTRPEGLIIYAEKAKTYWKVILDK